MMGLFLVRTISLDQKSVMNSNTVSTTLKLADKYRANCHLSALSTHLMSSRKLSVFDPGKNRLFFQI